MAAPVARLAVSIGAVRRVPGSQLSCRVRDRRAWSLVALDVVAAARGFRRRVTGGASRVPWHPGLVCIPGEIPRVCGGMSTRAPSHPAAMHGRSLFLARVAWVVVAGTGLAIVVFSVPSSYEYYSSACTAASRMCSERVVGQATPEGVRALRDMGLSVRFYAISNVVIDKVFQLVWFAVGALIFWRRSDERVALLTSLFLVTFGTVAVDPTAANSLASSQTAWWLPVRGVEIVGNVCSVLFFLLFPGGRFVPRWTLWLAVAFIAFQSSSSLFAGLYSSSPVLETFSYLVFLGIVVTLVWSQVYRYRRVSSPEQRRQT